MELVYLWVKEYKNIDSQGFNFSPKFTCKYDEDSNELTIDENNDYIENFFGDNINVTAIVGKNGSGKSSLLEVLEEIKNLKDIIHIIIYKREENFYCEYKNNLPNIIGDIQVSVMDNDSFSKKNTFYPKILRIAHSERIGEKSLSHYYFGEYSGLYGSMDAGRLDFYNMLEARFFVPRYVNIALEYFEIFKALKQMYKFDTLRLILRNNTTGYIRKYIDDEISTLKRGGYLLRHDIFCVYEKNIQTIKLIEEEVTVPVEEVEINLYNKERIKIVSTLEKIEKIHRSQTYDNLIKKYNKYTEFDLAILIAFIEYYLKNTEPCESCTVVYDELLNLEKEIEENLSMYEHRVRVMQSYILSFFKNLLEQKFAFKEDNLLNIDKIIESIEYLQKYDVIYFDVDGSPYIDIPIDNELQDNLPNLKIMQKIFFDYEYDCGNEKYLRVFEYNLINNQIGSSYETISDGEKHFIRFAIDIIYYLQTLKQQNYTPEKEQLAIFLADEPDNALHPIWKKRLIASVMEIFKNYLDMPNITVHFMYSTHSPFLLSDIPKQNIIFLDKDENGKCKVVDGLSQTFGQNIHTLLSDSFFMEGSLMGEFAKDKIEDLINFLKPKGKDKETKIQNYLEAEKLIAIIGEPVLQMRLEKMLESYKIEKQIETEDDVQKQITELKQKLVKMRNGKDKPTT